MSNDSFQPYISAKLVRARPATRGEAFDLAGVDPKPDVDLTEAGYAIQYPDGYRSWCPKAEFERTNRPLKDDELAALRIGDPANVISLVTAFQQDENGFDRRAVSDSEKSLCLKVDASNA